MSTTIAAEDISYLAAHPNNADGEDVVRLCGRIAELQADNKNLSTSVADLVLQRDDWQSKNDQLKQEITATDRLFVDATEAVQALRAQVLQLQSWQESTKSKLRNVAGWLNNGCAHGYAAAELLLIAGLPDDQSQPQPLAGEPSHGGLTQCDMHDDESF